MLILNIIARQDHVDGDADFSVTLGDLDIGGASFAAHVQRYGRLGFDGRRDERQKGVREVRRGRNFSNGEHRLSSQNDSERRLAAVSGL